MEEDYDFFKAINELREILETTIGRTKTKRLFYAMSFSQMIGPATSLYQIRLPNKSQIKILAFVQIHKGKWKELCSTLRVDTYQMKFNKWVLVASEINEEYRLKSYPLDDVIWDAPKYEL